MLEVIKIEEKGTEPEKGIEPKSGGGGAGGILKVLVLLVAVAGITAVVVYIGIGLGYNAMLNSKEETIVTLQDQIYELELEGPVSTPCPGAAAEAEIACSTCHDLDQTKGFHDTNTIKLMGEAKGTTPRICTICHGTSPHNVHQKKLSTGEMECNSCHVSPEGDYIVPTVPEGKTLVCEMCHVRGKQPEDMGNYISIHIVEANRDCNICHMGDPVKVHKKATEKLGVIG